MKTLALILSLAFASCATTTPCPVDVTKPCPTPAATCATACAQGAKLKCLWATPTPMGASCETVCTNAAATVPWNVKALTSASTCQ
jgi:hypothetical protein